MEDKMKDRASKQSDVATGTASTSTSSSREQLERQILNREIQLIYKALQNEKEMAINAESESPKKTDEIENEPSLDMTVDEIDEGSNEEDQIEDEPAEEDSKETARKRHRSPQTEMTADAETCLELNRSYQDTVSESIKMIQLLLAHNRARQSSLEEELEESMKLASTYQRKSITPTSFNIPYFKDTSGRIPPNNSDTELKKMDYNHHQAQKIKQWTDDQTKTLKKAVAADGRKRRMQPIMSKKEVEVMHLNAAKTPEEKASSRSRIEQLDEQLTIAKILSDDILIEDIEYDQDLLKIDWMKISTLDFEGEFSEQHLKQAWLNMCHPSISRNAWTPEEDELLIEAAEKHNYMNWANIAIELSAASHKKRSAFQCLQRYRTKQGVIPNAGHWTREEDDFLKEIVQNLTTKGEVPWNQVATLMEGRSIQQCREHWLSINRVRKRGRWSMDEDLKLASAVHCYGRNWKRIQGFVHGRSSEQCRERWVNALDVSLKHGKWTYEEDRHLILLVAKYGAKWTTIAKEMQGRTDNMLIQRYRRLRGWQETNQTLVALPKKSLHRGLSKRMAKTANYRKNFLLTQKFSRLLDQRQAEQMFNERHQYGDPSSSGTLPLRVLVKPEVEDDSSHGIEDGEIEIQDQQSEDEESSRDGLVQLTVRDSSEKKSDCEDNDEQNDKDDVEQNDKDDVEQNDKDDVEQNDKDDDEHTKQGVDDGSDDEEPLSESSDSANEDSITEEQRKQKHATKLLKKISCKNYTERRENHEREKELIEQDLKNGIYVPRPPDTRATVTFQKVEKRKEINTMIMQFVHEQLSTTAKGEPEQVYRSLQAHLDYQDYYKKGRKEATSDDSPDPIVDDAKSQALRQKREQLSKESQLRLQQVDSDLLEILRRPTDIYGRKPGRPRKYHFGTATETDHCSTQVKNKVCNLLMTTLNVDRVGAKIVAQAMKTTFEKTPPETASGDGSQPPNTSTEPLSVISEAGDAAGMDSTSEPTSNTMCSSENNAPKSASALVTNKHGKTLTELPAQDELGHDAISEAGKAAGMDSASEPTSNTQCSSENNAPKSASELVTNKHGNVFTELAAQDELGHNLRLSIPADDLAKSSISMMEKVIPLLNYNGDNDSHHPIPKLYRRKLIGLADRLYEIAPLPPSTTTMSALRRMLLHRRDLLRHAGNYFGGGKLMRMCDENRTAASSTSSTQDPTTRSIMPEGVHSSDLTPNIIKKLSIHFALNDIREAKELLELKEAEKLQREQKAAAERAEQKDGTTSEAEDNKRNPFSGCFNHLHTFRMARQSHEYQLLKARVESLFLWPAILSTFTPPVVENPHQQSSDWSDRESPPKKRHIGSTAMLAKRRKIKKTTKKAAKSTNQSQSGKREIINIETARRSGDDDVDVDPS